MGYEVSSGDRRFFLSAENQSQAEREIGIPIGTLCSYLADNGWYTEQDYDGNINTISFDECYWREKHENIIRQIAPYVRPGSWMIMYGEEGYSWRYYFIDDFVKEQEPIITWKDK
jgi:hypothetical protein